MSIIFLSVGEAGQVGEFPRRNKLVSSDNLTAITVPGYLNASNTGGRQIFPTDIFDVIFSYTPTSSFASASGFGTGSYAICTASISNGTITLVSYIDAALGSAAYLNATNSSLGKVAAVNAPSGVTIGDIAIFSDNAGSIQSAGFSMVSGTSTEWAGTGSATHVFPCPGITTAMNILVSPVQNNSTATILQAESVTNGNISVTYSATPGGAQNITYIGTLVG